jgi:transcriptional regulator with XRE-family HTH domain
VRSGEIPDIRYIMTREQSRAARGWLGWSQRELARRANISLSTVHDFESGQRTPIPSTIAAMCRAIEEAGVRLLFDQCGKAAGIARQDAGNDLFGDVSPR